MAPMITGVLKGANMDQLDRELGDLVDWLDQWLTRWREVHSRYRKTPTPEGRRAIRMKLRELEQELLLSEEEEV